MTKRILMIHAGGLLAKSLADQLTNQGFDVDTVVSIEQADQRLIEQTVDLVLFDAPSLAIAPAIVCQAVRARSADCPIVVLGIDRSDEAAVMGAGANVCLAKPYRFSGLLQRLQEQLRAADGGGEMPIGNFRLHPVARHLVDASGRRIHLTEKEAAILTYLHRAGSRVVPRDELLGEVWGYSSAVSTHTVETHIYRLRRKLVDESGEESPLATTGGGYRLN
ncbi:MAG TPA: response regulator transcription factor [Telmatospirillum sp.]|nr:response regulator transcription factor [Telmatospirillum sp.]